MDNDYRVWQDFNNISVEVKIDNIKYNSILYIKNGMLELKIDCTKNIEKFDRNIKIIDIINGKILKDSTKVTFINCFHHGMQSLGAGKDGYIYSIYKVDRVLLGIGLVNKKIKKISACEVIFKSIDDFFNERIFNVNFISNNVQIKSFCKEHKYNQDKLIFKVLSRIEENEDEGYVLLNKEIVVDLKNTKKICFDDTMKKIYFFRNLMMILLKRNVIVEKQTLKINEKEYRLFDCHNYEIKSENEELRSQLIYRKIKYEDIEDFNSVLEKFNLIYDRIYPLLELLYNAYSNNLPNLNRFLDAITMIEYYSREFDNTEALKLTNTKFVDQDKKGKDEPEFKDRVKSLIININEVFKFSESEIDEISKNVKDGRTYYVHYVKKGWKLSHGQLFGYYNFLEDIILLNIYKLIGINITQNEYITYFNFYYTKQKLLNREENEFE